MMELKIVCQCGQKYKFDVEPVNGRMPFTVKCPICHVDGTPTANDALARLAAVPPPPPRPPAPALVPAFASAPPPSPFSAPAPAPVSAFTPAPAPVATTASYRPAPATAPMPTSALYPDVPPPSPAPIAPVPVAGLQINKAPVHAAAPAAIAPPPVAAPGRAPLPSSALRGVPAIKVGEAKFSLPLGIGGAVLGTLVGCGLMYGFFEWAQFRFPLMGTGVGLLAGLGARLLARGTDSTLGIITAVIAGAAVSGTLVLMYGEFPMMSILSVIACCVFANRVAS